MQVERAIVLEQESLVNHPSHRQVPWIVGRIGAIGLRTLGLFICPGDDVALLGGMFANQFTQGHERSLETDQAVLTSKDQFKLRESDNPEKDQV